MRFDIDGMDIGARSGLFSDFWRMNCATPPVPIGTCGWLTDRAEAVSMELTLVFPGVKE